MNRLTFLKLLGLLPFSPKLIGQEKHEGIKKYNSSWDEKPRVFHVIDNRAHRVCKIEPWGIVKLYSEEKFEDGDVITYFHSDGNQITITHRELLDGHGAKVEQESFVIMDFK